jgi:hypothetical protein
MQVDHGELGEYYASLNDEELLGLKREDLTEAAQVIYDMEIARRDFDKTAATRGGIERADASFFDEGNCESNSEASISDWLPTGVMVCAFADQPGHYAGEKVAKAQTALHAAGIPSHYSEKRYPGEPFDTIEVLVPMGCALHAASIMDRDLLNDEFETYWRDHLGMVSDEDLEMLDPDIFCAGLADKIARMKKAYAEEMTRRNLKARGI